MTSPVPLLRGKKWLAMFGLLGLLTLLADDEGSGPRVEVEPETVILRQVGDSATLTARALDATGSVDNGATFTWSSSDSAVVDVQPRLRATARVFARSLGTAVISVESNGATARATVVVSP
jgi:uncharacterized protein YjdB